MKFPVRKTAKQMCHHWFWQCYKDLKNIPLLHPHLAARNPDVDPCRRLEQQRESVMSIDKEKELLCYLWNRKESVMSIDKEKELLCYPWNRKESIMSIDKG
jgi:hypothetical protein